MENSYIPKHYKVENEEFLFAFVQKNSFATVFTTNSTSIPEITHIPISVEKNENGKWVLQGHLAYANMHWKSIQRYEEEKLPLLIEFTGPHTYISPSYFKSSEVPTWNYGYVRVYGIPRMLNDENQKRKILNKLINKYESARKNPWSLDSLPTEHVDNQIKKIKFFEVVVDKIEGKLKMSQNRTEEDQLGIIDALLEGSIADKEVAQVMLELRKK